jgi:hypothetical protein
VPEPFSIIVNNEAAGGDQDHKIVMEISCQASGK